MGMQKGYLAWTGCVAGPHTYQKLMIWTQCVCSCTTGGLVLWALHGGPGWPGRRAHFRCRLGLLNKTSSHMWGSWYFPMFLIRDGSLTLMNMVSLVVLVMVRDSLPTMEKFFNLV